MQNSIFTVPVLDKYLLYAPLQGLSALLNRTAVTRIKNAITGKEEGHIERELSALIRELRTAPVKNPDKTGDFDPPFLGIIPSRRCNMSCSYCDFGSHKTPGEVIDPGILISAIDHFAATALKNKKDSLQIQFFGGEPFVEQDTVNTAVHHARMLCSRTGLMPRFTALSNGYYDDNTRLFIKDYFDKILISFDGFKKYHDRTRPAGSMQSSYDTVAETIKYLSTAGIELGIRCCVTSESVNDMENMALWFREEFNPDAVNFETLTGNSEADKAGLAPPDPYDFARGCVKSGRLLRENNIETPYAPISLRKVRTTSCPAGRDVVIVHPDGMLASCYLLSEKWKEKNLDLTVGEIRKNGQVDIDMNKIEKLRNPVYAKPRCEGCFCRFGCAGNCHVNCTYPGSSPDYTDFCVHTRVITAAMLLEEMDMKPQADELLQDPDGQRKLALNKSDKITLMEFDE